MSIVRCLRGKAKHCLWWVLFIDEQTGCVSILSDYGNYAYRWNPRAVEAESVAHFLLDAGTDYLLNKLTTDEFDAVATEAAAVSALKEAAASSDADIAAESEALEETLENLVNLANEFELYDLVFRAPASIGGILQDSYRTGPPRQARVFMQEVWPDICEALRKELA